MKKNLMLVLLFGVCTALAAKSDDVMKKSKGEYTVNTTTLCNTRGFKGVTPLEVVIKKGKITAINSLQNRETPRFWQRIVDELFPQYIGKKLEETEKVDIITGATYSSKSVKDNVKAAIDYYKKNK